MAATVPELVSVIIPAFNAAPWIGAAVASVRAQDYAPIEIILAENGSTDDTVAAALAVSEVKVLRVAQRGASAARNAGLEQARGEFVQFVDADDVLAPGKVARHVAALRRWDDVDVVWSAFTRFEDGPDCDPFAGRLCEPPLGADTATDLVRDRGFLHLGACLFRARSLSSTRFRDDMPVLQDVRFVVEVAASGARFRHLPGPPAYALREHESPHRVSRIGGATQFWDDCTRNARFLRDHWAARGEPLTSERVDVLSAMLYEAAEVFHRADDPRFDGVLADLRELDPHFMRRLRFPQRLIGPALGLRRTIAVVDALRRVRGSIRRVAR